MANPEHLAILEKGVEAWNNWREENLDVSPNLIEANVFGANLDRANLDRANLFQANLNRAHLSGASLCKTDLGGANLIKSDLSGANLREASLGKANLREANLDGANLGEANLIGAILIRANLVRANLGEALLSEANLSEANLIRANLGGAHLIRANFSGANLNEANLKNADLYETILGDVDLTTIEDLDKCAHHGPSIVDHRTLMKSPNLPLSFLRGVGLPDDFIEYLPAFQNQPIQYYSCFISYSDNDKVFAEQLYANLQAKGVRCWFAPENLKIGDKFRPVIHESIRLYDKLLLVLSERSIASSWVEEEVVAALDKEERYKKEGQDKTVLFPIRLDEAVMEIDVGWAATIRRTRHIGDFRKWKEHDAYQKAFDRLLRDLKGEIQKR